MGLWNKLFGGADGCREAMRESYAKHVQMARQGKIAMGDTDSPHVIGLYGALGSRYRVRGLPVIETLIWGELAPFLAMKEQQAIEALAEYVLFQERPSDARVAWLKGQVNMALRSCNDGTWLGMAAFGLDNQVPWCSLLEPGVRGPIEDSVKGLNQHRENTLGLDRGPFDSVDKNDLGGLDLEALRLVAIFVGGIKDQDWPEELANTAANVYYRQGLHSVSRGIDVDSAVAFEERMRQNSQALVDAQFLGDAIGILREMPRQTAKQRNEYDHMVQLILDRLKYGIRHAENMTPEQLAIERKRRQPDEIPDLYKLATTFKEVEAGLAPKTQGEPNPDSERTHKPNHTAGNSAETIVDCPSCQQRLRVPKGRHLRVTCPKCASVFDADLRE